MNFLKQQSPSSVIVSSREKRRIGLQPEELKGKPLFVPGNQKSAPVNQYAGLWMRDSTKGKPKQDYDFIERVFNFNQAQVSYFSKFFKLEQESISEIIRFVSCIKDDELAMKVNALIKYIKSWPDPNQPPRPSHQKQPMSVFSIRNEQNNIINNENSQIKRKSFFSSTTTSPEDTLNINSNKTNSPNNYSGSSTPVCSQSPTPFFRTSPKNTAPNSPIATSFNNPYFSIKNDVRFSEIKEISRIPINGAAEITFNFPPIANQRFFLSLLSNNNLSYNTNNMNLNGFLQPPPRWPISLQIQINESIIKAAGSELVNNFIDVSELNPKTLKLVNRNMADQIIISIIGAIFKSYDQMVDTVQIIDNNNFSAAPNLNQQPTEVNCLFCPITGKLMKYPGRGIRCEHKQCFDIKTFMKIINRTGRNFCPICQKKIELNELAISQTARLSVNKIRSDNSPNFSSSLTSSPLEGTIFNIDKDDDNTNDDIRMIGFSNEDFGFPNDEIGEQLPFELNNSFTNEL